MHCTVSLSEVHHGKLRSEWHAGAQVGHRSLAQQLVTQSP